MKALIASLMMIACLFSPAQAQAIDSKCVTADKFISEIQTGLGSPITLTKYNQETTIKILLIFYKDAGIDISMIDPKKLAGSIFIKSERFPNAVIMIMTADKDYRVACYNATISMKIYKYTIDKLGLTEI